MEPTQKEKIKSAIASAADELSDRALAAAREKTNRFWKLMLYLVGIMLAGIAALAGFTGCQNMPHVTLTVEQLQMAEAAYTLTGQQVKYRIVPVDPIKK